ncbi:Hsp70 family protein [Solwaraspora sp. WMMA2101]|uniref:Hsp70 family protein n=1 Tax=Solwaraspora sp. WMMA2101 TaxID=3404124 RepID=UPI003B935546
MGPVYGVDFGTCKSAIAVGRADGTTVVCRDPRGEYGQQESVPTSVFLTAAGDLVVGTAAERAKGSRPGHFRSEFKADVGSDVPFMIGGRAFTTEQLAAEVLGFLRGLARDQVPGDPETVVITVPASWEQGRRDRMLAAAVRAGFDPDTVRIVFEPVAAAAEVFAGTTGAPMTALIFDLGGGTFDCTVARSTPNRRFEVLGASGHLSDVGGRWFDRRIVRHIADEFPEATAFLRGPAGDADLLRRRELLRADVERMKIVLSGAPSAHEFLSELDVPQEFELTRAALDGLLDPYLTRALDTAESMLNDMGLSWAEIDRIVPVGGSSRIPLVGRLLSRRSGRIVLRLDRPDLTVVRGAVALARMPAHHAWPAGDRASDGVIPQRLITGQRLSAVSFAPTGSRIALGSVADVRVQDLASAGHEWRTTGSGVPPLLAGTAYPPVVTAVAFSPTGELMASGGLDGTARVWNAVRRERLVVVDHADWVSAVAFSPDGRRLATASYDRTARVSDAVTGRQLFELPHPHFVRAIAVSPDGRLLATGCADRLVRVWDLLTARTVRELPHDDWVNALAFDAAGRRLAAASYDGRCRIWSVDTGALLHELRHDDGVGSVAFSRDGRFVATGSDDGTARIWSATGELLTTTVHGGRVSGVAFSPGGGRLASAGQDGTVLFTALPESTTRSAQAGEVSPRRR